MGPLLQYPRQLLTTAEVLELLRLKDRKSLRRLQALKGFPRASISAGERGQRFRASLVDDWIKRQERMA
jgi:hypothetical protein